MEQKAAFPTQSRRARVARSLETLVHWLMFGVSGVFSVRLFLELASSTTDKYLYGLLAIGFEGTKIILWEIGRRGQRFIALCMVVMSLLASAGAALTVAERTQNAGADPQRLAAMEDRISGYESALAQCDSAIENLTTQIAGLPPTYVTAALRLQAQLESLYERQGALQADKLEAVDAIATYRGSTRDTSSMVMFELMAGALRMPQEKFVLVFMLAVAVLLELGALGTTERQENDPLAAYESLSKPLPRCTCGSARTSVERTADGESYTIVCKSCGARTHPQSSELAVREEWSQAHTTHDSNERSSLWKKLSSSSRRKAVARS